MEGHFSTGRSPRWAVVPMEEEEEGEEINIIRVKFDVLVVLNTNISIFGNVTPCGSEDG